MSLMRCSSLRRMVMLGLIAISFMALLATGAQADAQEGIHMWFMEPKDALEPYGLLEFRSSPIRFVAETSATSGGVLFKEVVPRDEGGFLPTIEGGWWLYGHENRSVDSKPHWSIVRYFTTDGIKLIGPQRLHEEPNDGWLYMWDIAKNGATGEMLFLKYQLGTFGFPLMAYGSADGLAWQPLSDQPVYHDHDAFGLFWDKRTSRYISYQATYQNWSKRRPDNVGAHIRRVLSIRTSLDGLRWTPDYDVSYWNRPQQRAPVANLIMPNEQDPPDLEFYLMTVFNYGDRYVAMVLNYAPSPEIVNQVEILSGHGPFLSAEWWTSDDGFNWRRPYQGQDVIGDAPTLMMHPPIQVGSELRWVMPPNTYAIDVDRLAGVYSKSNGEFSTEVFTMPDSRLLLNVAAKYREIPTHPQATIFATDRQAYVMAELQDQFGRAIRGYEREKAAWVNVDEAKLPLLWDGKDGTELAGKQVRLRFFFRDATVYALHSE